MDIDHLIGSPKSDTSYDDVRSTNTVDDLIASPLNVRRVLVPRNEGASSPHFHFSPRLAPHILNAFGAAHGGGEPWDDDDEANVAIPEDDVAAYKTPPASPPARRPRHAGPPTVSPAPPPPPPPRANVEPEATPAPPPPPVFQTVWPPPSLVQYATGDLAYIACVDKTGSNGKAQRRVLCVTSTALLLYDPSKDAKTDSIKALKRAVDLLHIHAIQTSVQKRRASILSSAQVSRTSMVVKVPWQYDLVFQVVDEQDRSTPQGQSPAEEFYAALSAAVRFRLHTCGLPLSTDSLSMTTVSNVLDGARLDRTLAHVAYRGPIWALQEIACEQRHTATNSMTRDELLLVTVRLQQRLSEVLLHNARLINELAVTKDQLETIEFQNQL